MHNINLQVPPYSYQPPPQNQYMPSSYHPSQQPQIPSWANPHPASQYQGRPSNHSQNKLPSIYRSSQQQPQMYKSRSHSGFNHQKNYSHNRNSHHNSGPMRQTQQIMNPNLMFHQQGNKHPANNFNSMFPMMMCMSMMSKKGKQADDPEDSLVLNLIERQNQQIRQFMAPQKKETGQRNKVVLKKIEFIEKKLREEDLAKKKNTQSPVTDLFFIQNMIQGSNSMLQSVGADDKAAGKDGGQDVMQKFMLMKLMETMGKGNQPQPQFQEQPEVVQEEVKEEESESESESSDDEIPDMTGHVQITSPDGSPGESPDGSPDGSPMA